MTMGTSLGTGDSYMVHNLLSDAESESVFSTLLAEISWQQMYHVTGLVPRLVSCQGTIDAEGNMPVYRHPSDTTLPLNHWTPTVLRCKRHAEDRVGHELNHVLVQLYRGGTDYISEHSDKTLDIAPGSNIVNISFGAQRTMRLRSKRAADATSGTSLSAANLTSPGARETQKIVLPHNSMLVMSLSTNKSYLHAIKADKRREAEKSGQERHHDGMRISLTFRCCATYISHDSSLIWGQGATAKMRDQARSTVNGVTAQSEALIRAFAVENHSGSEFDWEATYGDGFDVLHLKSDPGERPLFFSSGRDDDEIKQRIESSGLDVDIVQPPGLNVVTQPVYRDIDRLHTVIHGSEAILAHLRQTTGTRYA